MPVPRADDPAPGHAPVSNASAARSRWLARCIITVLPVVVLLFNGALATGAQAAVNNDAAEPATTAPVKVAAASSLRVVWPRLMQASPGTLRTTISFGSSGNLARQIIQGAPYEVFLSASEEHAQLVRDAPGKSLPGELYALGQLSLVTRKPTDADKAVDLDGLAAALQARPAPGQVRRRLAIANPAHAPYGLAARQVLEQIGAWSAVEVSVSLAENAAQTLQFVRAGAVWAALVPRSLVSEPASRVDLHVVDIDPALHAPVRHEMVLLAPTRAAARALFDFLRSDTARGILEDAGFGVPSVR